MNNMKLLAALSLLAAPTLIAATPAGADRIVTRERTVVRHDEHRGYDNGRHNGWRTRRVCDWKWRNHHKVRVCRTVRFHR